MCNIIFAVSCGLPDLLDQSSNNSTEETDTTTVPSHEGSQLRFLCTDDEEIIVTCSSNGSWTPDLSDVQCSDIHPFVRYIVLHAQGSYATFDAHSL